MASTTWGSGPSSCPGITPEGEELGFALRSGEGSHTAHDIPAKGPGCCSHLQRPQAPFMACVCMCMNVYAQGCSRWKQRQAHGPKTPYAPTLPHPCRRRCATNTQWGQRAVLFQGGPPPASLQAEPPGTDGLIRHTQSLAFCILERQSSMLHTWLDMSFTHICMQREAGPSLYFTFTHSTVHKLSPV